MPEFTVRQSIIRVNWYHVVLHREGLLDEVVDVMVRSTLEGGPTVYALVCLATDLTGERASQVHFHPSEWSIDGAGRGTGGVATDDVMNSVRVAPGQRLFVRLHLCRKKEEAGDAMRRGGGLN